MPLSAFDSHTDLLSYLRRYTNYYYQALMSKSLFLIRAHKIGQRSHILFNYLINNKDFLLKC
jgi:hypothetical protein